MVDTCDDRRMSSLPLAWTGGPTCARRSPRCANVIAGTPEVRVHVFARRFPSLSQTFVLNQCTGLLDLGVDVTVFADGADATGLTQPDAVAGRLMDRIRHYAIPEPWSHRPLPALQLMATASSLSMRQRLALIAPWRGGAESRSGRLLFEGAAVAREPKSDVLHAHFGPVGAMVQSLRDARVLDAPLVTTFYGYDVSRTPASRYRALFRGGDAFLVLGEAMRARLLAMGAPPERVHVHRLGVDLGRFAPSGRARSPNAESVLHLLSIARLVPKKGIADALCAVARARARVASLRYTIIGDGPLRAELERLASSLGIADVVDFAGWKTQQDVLAIARTARVVLAPSVTAPDGDAEGTPVAILEAQALAIPVIATHHAGIPEVVVDGETAILAKEHDVEALASAIVALADPQRSQRMGEAGRALVERQHDIRRLNEALLARFESLTCP